METKLTEEQMLNETFEVTCNECGGHGVMLTIDKASIGSAPDYDEWECEMCDGSGTRSMTMNEIYDEHDSIHSELPDELEEIISWWDGDNTEAIFNKLVAWEQAQ